MLHGIIVGVVMGWGAAIPVGPVNLEIARRNLHLGTRAGLVFGSGACLADLTYLALLSLGAMVFLEHPLVLAVMGLLGSFILLWFAYKAMVAKAGEDKRPKNTNTNLLDGYLMTLINPYTILFWASITSQLSLLNKNQDSTLMLAGFGLLLGVFSWILLFSFILHHGKTKISGQFTQRLNRFGGGILILFAVVGIIKSISMLWSWLIS